MRALRFRAPAEAVAEIPDGSTVAVAGTGPVLEPDAVLAALEERFLAEGSPAGLTVVTPMCPGERPGVGGMNCFAHEHMVAKLITSSLVKRRHPRLLAMLEDGEIEGYMAPMGSLVRLFGAIGAGHPGILTDIGAGTSVDPRLGGGAMNARSKNPPVRIVEIAGREHLYYPSFPVDVAVIRASVADERGNLSLADEPNTLAVRELALAAHASGGTVIAQVRDVVEAGTLHPRRIEVPGLLVDVVVCHPEQTQLTPGGRPAPSTVDHSLTGSARRPLRGFAPVGAGAKRILLRRAAHELRPGDVANVGAGVATHLPRVVHEEGLLERVTFTNEHGVIGGLVDTARGGTFVTAMNTDVLMDSTFQFAFYDGGGLDVAFLGIGQVDGAGNVNVSYFDGTRFGPGGLNSIAERADRVVFCGTLTAGGLDVTAEDGDLRIVREGRAAKFVDEVDEVTFSAEHARARGTEVRYVTERAVFDLGPSGLELVEVAQGVDADREVLAHLGCRVQVADRLRRFPSAVLGAGPMGSSLAVAREPGAERA